MRVDMKIEPSTGYIGWFGSRPVHQIVLDVQLTEEEKWLVNALCLQNQVLFTIPFLEGQVAEMNLAAQDGYSGNAFLVEYFYKSQRHKALQFDRLIDAKNAIPMIEDSFRALKQLLDSADIPDHRAFEL
jgi:hypothetical protein